MVAAFEVFLDTGGSNANPALETNTDPLGPPNIRFKRADDPTIDGADPNIIPTGPKTISRWKQIYLKNLVAPDTQVDNVKIFTDESGFGLGISVEIGDENPTKNSGSDAGYNVSDIDDEDMTGHGGISGHTDFFVHGSGDPVPVSISEAASVIDAMNETTDYVVLQMEVLNTATPGNLADETITYEYDEI